MRLLSITLFLLLSGCNNQNQFTINGTVLGVKDGDVRLFQVGESFMDSKVCQLHDQKFSFTGIIEQPEEFSLVYEESGPKTDFDSYSVFIEPDKVVDVTLNPKNYQMSKIEGPRISMLYDQALKELDILYRSSLYDLKDKYYTATEKNDSIAQDSLLRVADSLNIGVQSWKIDYIRTNPKSYISAFFLYSIYFNISEEDTEQLYEGLNSILDDSKYTIAVKNYLSILPGNPFIDFSLIDSDGNVKFFGELAENRVVLIDFWASWCSPCREQNKILSKLYEDYKSKGFKVVGVSIDRDSTAFKNAIIEDSMEWVNLIDRIDGTSVSKIYRSQSIPSNILIDKNGIIRYRDVDLNKIEDIITGLLEE